MVNMIIMFIITGGMVFIGGVFGYNYGYSRAVLETEPIIITKQHTVYVPCKDYRMVGWWEK